MLWAYFDESGEHGLDGRLTGFTFGGAVAPAAQWKRLGAEWCATLQFYGIDMFHMVDFEAKQKQFRGWEQEKRKALLAKLLDISLEYVSEFVGFVALPESETTNLVDAYEIIANKALRDFAINAYHSGDPTTMVFAQHPNFSDAKLRKLFDLWDNGDERLLLGEMGNPRDLPPLQVADIVAYEINKAFRHKQPDKERYPFSRLKVKMRPITLKLIPNKLIPENSFLAGDIG